MEIQPFIRKKNTLFMQNSLNTKPFSIKKYLFTIKALYWNNNLYYFLFRCCPLFQMSSEWNISIYLEEIHLFMQNSHKTEPFMIKKYIFTTKAICWNESLHYFFRWSPLVQKSSDWKNNLYNKGAPKFVVVGSNKTSWSNNQVFK